jgi:hypothetical protein
VTTSPIPTALCFTPSAPRDKARGLLGFLSCRYGDLVLGGIAVRRTRDGRHVLSFPVRHDRNGDQHHIVRPVDDDARKAIEAAVFDALGLQVEAAS